MKKIVINLLLWLIILCCYSYSSQGSAAELLPALHEAVFHGDLPLVEHLVKEGADVNEIEPMVRSTPLHWAVLHERRAIMEFLLAKGSRVNAGDRDSATPLHYAARLGCITAARLLLACGADINAKDRHGGTVLHYAADSEIHWTQWLSVPVVSEYRLHETVQLNIHGKQEIVKLFLGKGVKPDIKDNRGYTPLHRAAKGETVDIVTVLLSKGANVNAKTPWGWTPLHAAAINGRTAIVELLLSHGAEVSAKTDEGETPMGVAMRSYSQNKEEVIELLRQYGGIAIERECR